MMCVLLANLREGLLVFRAEGDLVDFCFPEEVALIGLFLRSHVLAALHVDGVFRFNAEDFGFLACDRLPFEHFVDRRTSDFKVLLELIAGDELGRTHGIESTRSGIGGYEN